MKSLYKLLTIIVLLGVVGCDMGTLPDSFSISDNLPKIYPDYCGATVPANIAPLNFKIVDSSAVKCVAMVGNIVAKSNNECEVQFPENLWKNLLNENRGDSIAIAVFCKDKAGNWTRYKDFYIFVADCNIDPYISYRLIEPSYSVYGNMNISQRCLENFDESVIYSTTKVNGQCVNCHCYQNFGTQKMLYHRRVIEPGTVITIDGEQHIVNLKRDNTISAGVYPSWHPTENLIAFSTNKTHQQFLSKDINKVEVFDTESDLILYDVDSDLVSVIVDDKTNLETFPTWSPDGKWLYYCSARVDENTFSGNKPRNHKSIKYDILRRGFNSESRTFSSADTIYCASSFGKSCSLPRISPDGKFIVFAEGEFGTFHIWHHDSDIKIMNIESGEFVDTQNLNSDGFADSYPTFSSNGNWVMCASRRDDGQFSRVYISYFDGEKLGKAFLLPQKEVSHNIMRILSYNRPEFMREKVE